MTPTVVIPPQPRPDDNDMSIPLAHPVHYHLSYRPSTSSIVGQPGVGANTIRLHLFGGTDGNHAFVFLSELLVRISIASTFGLL